MGIQRIPMYPYPESDLTYWARRLSRALNQEAVERIQDFDITKLSNVAWKACRAYSSFENAISNIGSTETILLVQDVEAIADNVTIPSTMTLRLVHGGSLSIASGKTVTMNGHIEAGLHQIFEGAGSVDFGANTVREIYPEWWGIDGTADEVQINAAINSLPVVAGVTSFGVTPSSFGGTVWLNGTYTIAAPVIIFEGIVLDGHSMFTTEIYNGATSSEDAVQAINGGRATNEFFPAVRNMKITGNGSSGDGLYIYKPNYGIYENLLIKGHGGNGIFVRGPQVGGTFRNIYSAYNSGWGCMAGDVNEDVDITVLRFYDCQFRENTLGGALLFQCYQTTMDNPIFEDNAGPGLRIEGKYSVITNPYFESNYGGVAVITGASQANPCVITCAAGHNYLNGQKVIIYDVEGMTELNGIEYTVANEAATTFELSGINSGGYGLYTAGGKVSADALEFNRDNTACYENVVISPFFSDGIIHIEGGDYNQIIAPRLAGEKPNILIDVNSDYNVITFPRAFTYPLTITDNGTGTQAHRADLKGSDTWDPGSIPDGDEEAKEVTVTGAVLGDFAIASFSLDVTDLVLNAQVTANDTVTCILANNTGGAIDLASGTIYVKVIKR